MITVIIKIQLHATVLSSLNEYLNEPQKTAKLQNLVQVQQFLDLNALMLIFTKYDVSSIHNFIFALTEPKLIKSRLLLSLKWTGWISGVGKTLTQQQISIELHQYPGLFSSVDSRCIHNCKQLSQILMHASAAGIQHMTSNGTLPTMHFSPY